MTPPRLARVKRNTRQRQLVRRVLQELGPHASADEIEVRAREIEPRLARSTVYRALDFMEGTGEVRVVHLDRRRYEIGGGAHQHAVCRVCGAVLNLDDGALRTALARLLEQHQFQPIRSELTVIGLCRACRRGGPG